MRHSLPLIASLFLAVPAFSREAEAFIVENGQPRAQTGQPPAADGRLDSFNPSDAVLEKPGANGRAHLVGRDNGNGNFGLR